MQLGGIFLRKSVPLSNFKNRSGFSKIPYSVNDATNIDFLIRCEGLETKRGPENALFQDPFARYLQGPKGEQLSKEFGSNGAISILTYRTQICC